MAAILLIISLFTFAHGQEVKSVQQTNEIKIPDSDDLPLKCSEQSATERESLIREATKSEYTIRRVVFIGNTHTRDSVLRRGMSLLQEGELFNREKLIRGLANVNR